MAYTQQEFSQMIKTKYPSYSGMNDNDLVNAVISKYPQYSSQVIIEEESPSLLQRAGSAITSIPNIAKAGVEKVSAGVSDIGGAFKPETFVAREGEDQMVSSEIAGKRSLINRLEQAGQGLQRIGAGGLTTTFGVTPIGAGVSAGFGAAEPEVQQAIQSQPIQTIMNKFDMLPEDVQEAVVNLAESVPFAPKGAQQSLTKGIQQTATGIKKVASAPVTATVQALGKTTGAGAEAIQEAFKQSARQAPEFKKALRGDITPEQTLGEAKEALGKVKDSRRSLYGEDYAKVEANKNPLDIEDVKSDFIKTLENNNIKIEKTDTGLKLNFDESKLRKSSQGKVELQDTFDDLMTWKNTDPSGLDILKQRIREGYKGATDTGLSDKIHTEYANKIKDKIIQEVPEYKKMSETYEALTREIEDITKTLSLGSKANAQTAITKLSSALRENFPFRKDMIDLLEQYSGTNLKGQIAGQQLNPMLAKGLAGVITGGGLIFGQLANPAFWAGLALASPRLIGEIANAVGLPINAVRKGIENIRKLISKSVPNNINANTVKNPVQGNKVKVSPSVSQKTTKVKPLEKNTVTYKSEQTMQAPKVDLAIEAKKYKSADDFVKAVKDKDIIIGKQRGMINTEVLSARELLTKGDIKISGNFEHNAKVLSGQINKIKSDIKSLKQFSTKDNDSTLLSLRKKLEDKTKEWEEISEKYWIAKKKEIDVKNNGEIIYEKKLIDIWNKANKSEQTFNQAGTAGVPKEYRYIEDSKGYSAMVPYTKNIEKTLASNQYWHGTPGRPFLEFKKNKPVFLTKDSGFANDYAKEKAHTLGYDNPMIFKVNVDTNKIFDISKHKQEFLSVLPEKITIRDLYHQTKTMTKNEFLDSLIKENDWQMFERSLGSDNKTILSKIKKLGFEGIKMSEKGDETTVIFDSSKVKPDYR